MSGRVDATAVAPSPRHGADALVAATPTALARARTFHTLDALRGVAAIVVLLFHAAFFFGLPAPAEGYLAVDLFFVMSGFIIAHRYADDLARGMGVRRFLVVRLQRLYPLFLLGTLLGVVPALAAVVGGQGDHTHWGQLESLPFAVLMLPSRLAMPHIGELYPLNYVSWSLALEIAVNLAFAATHRIWSTRRLAMLAVLALAVLCAAASRFGSLNVGWGWENASGGLARILFGFTLGVLIQRLHAARRIEIRVPWWLPVVLVPGILYFDPAQLGLAWARPAWDVAIAALAVPVVVAAAITTEPPGWAQGACALAGLGSYVLYSLHAPFVGLFVRGEQRLHLDLATTSPARTIVFTALLAALCVVGHLCYDKPVRARLARRRATRRLAVVRAQALVAHGS